MSNRARLHVAVAIAAAATVLIVYAGTLHFDLYWDDYGTLKPHTWDSLQRVWHGSWDAGPPFYRPISAWYFALCFHLLGLNGVALHMVSIAELTLAGWLIGVFASREADSIVAGACAAAVFAAHPGTAFSSGPFFVDQFHLLSIVAAMSALLLWQRRRTKPSASGWWPIAGVITAGFLVKEDMAMLAPVIVIAQTLRARIVGDVPPPTRRLWMQMAAFVAILAMWRWTCVGTLGIYSLPDLRVGAMNLVRGPYRILLWLPHESQWRALVTAWQFAAIATGAWIAWRRSSPRITALWMFGATWFVCADLPLLLASNMTRYHLLTVAASLMAASGIAGVWELASGRTRLPLALVTAGGLTALCLCSRDALVDYRPCTPSNLERDRDILSWDLVPADLRDWLLRKPDACAAGTYAPIVSSVDVVRWTVAPNRMVALVANHANSATVTVRVEGASPASPVELVAINDAGQLLPVTIASGDWVDVRLPLASSALSWSRQMRMIDLRVEAHDAPGRRLDVGAVRIE